MTNERRVLVHRDTASLTGSVAARFVTKVIDLLDEKDEVHIVLTGGGVGTGILRSINDSEARDSIDWARVHVWWGDERWLPRGHAERNDVQARAALLDDVALVPKHVHAYPASDENQSLDEASASYAAELASASEVGSGLPVFDITFLGVGPDGHVASLFPERAGIRAETGTVVAVRDAPKPPPERLSLTLGAINTSERIWLALAGMDKASALGLALAGADPVEVPAAGPLGRRRTVFFVDSAAAAEVPDDLISREY